MISTAFDLTDHRALVTGSTRGIGAAIARGFLDAGASVVIHGRDSGRVDEECSKLGALYGASKVDGRAFDVTDEDDVAASIRGIETTLGPIDILVNNAGLQHRVPILELALRDWDRVLRGNLTSTFLVSREVARFMIPRRRGKVINVGSIQSELARPTLSAYTASKGGVRNLTRAMAAEWGPSGLQVNALAPGYVHTDMTQNLVDDPTFNNWVTQRTPAGRWGTTADLIGPAIWLSSSASDFVNGQTIFVDGGMTAVV